MEISVENEEDIVSNLTIVIILDQRENELLGFDFVSLPEANIVSGIWNLRPGAHFIYIKDDESEEADETRFGEFIYLKKGEIKVIRRSADETGSPFEIVEDYCNESYKESVINGKFKNRMANVPKELADLWSSMTDCINGELINKLRPIRRAIKSRGQKLQRDSIVTGRGDVPDPSAVEFEDEFSRLSINSKGGHSDECETPNDNYIYYSDIPLFDSKIKDIKNITPEMVTRMHLDTSYILDHLRDEYQSSRGGYKCTEYGRNYHLYVLGELQFSFILFLLCYNIDSFEQYKKLLRAFCNAETVLIENENLTHKLFKTLQLHIETWDESNDVFQKDNFFVTYLANLREIVLDNEIELSHSSRHFKRLEDSFKLKFGISLADLDMINNCDP
ncbi:hypothetical protein BEWA_042420 [Theileria equi strain WA]|uniref:Uncharacterized protein n=1 Tax=Theileria equi strain WA TaxID=1537102 RepID=L1LG06_THEEQ|nr:hypothetical protein BEWA_042420 [Theileria equi strain WA]EKX74204.1 hypothetical protein BEWA_042420 [Theileria equi strain WA]|eukprot:XP_004833656.1 hypothetical protein BEWA_042420 [Theileria equi strain WA]